MAREDVAPDTRAVGVEQLSGRSLDVAVAVEVLGWLRVGQNYLLSPLHLDVDDWHELDWDHKGPHDVLERVGHDGRSTGSVWLCGCRANQIDLLAYHMTNYITSAWSVVEHLSLNRGWRVTIQHGRNTVRVDVHAVLKGDGEPGTVLLGSAVGSGAEAATVICRAAVAAYRAWDA